MNILEKLFNKREPLKLVSFDHAKKELALKAKDPIWVNSFKQAVVDRELKIFLEKEFPKFGRQLHVFLLDGVGRNKLKRSLDQYGDVFNSPGNQPLNGSRGGIIDPIANLDALLEASSGKPLTGDKKEKLANDVGLPPEFLG